MEPRLVLAYVLIGACLTVTAAALAVYMPRRRQQRLRRRGIKAHNLYPQQADLRQPRES